MKTNDKKGMISLYLQPREKALEIIRQRAKNEALSSEMESIYIGEEMFFQAFLKDYEETVLDLKARGKI